MVRALQRPVHLLRSTLLLIRTAQYRELARKIRYRIIDDHSLVGLKLNLDALPPPVPGESITVRPAGHSDVASVLDLKEPDLPRRERHDRIRRHRMLESGIQTCYVAQGTDGVPCFVQWLILSEQNDRLREVFGGWYPPLQSRQAMIECVYTHPSRRGQGVMASATPQILAIARDQGIQTVVTYIPTGNTRSLRIHLRMGFVPFLLHLERRRLGILKRDFLPINSLSEVGRWVSDFEAGEFDVAAGNPNR